MSTGHSPFAGTALIARTHLRSGWRPLLLWTLGLIAMVVAIASSIKGLYPTLSARLGYAESVGTSPATAAFNGRGYDLSTMGGIAAYEVGFMGMFVMPIVLAHLAIRLTRHEEDAGRTELVRSGPVGRLASIAAAVLMLALVAAVFIGGTAIGLTALGYSPGGSWAYAAVLGLFGLAFGALAVLAAEVSADARTAYGLTMLVVLVSFLVRAIVDGRGWRASWASPMGWLAEARPWGEVRWWPSIAYLALIGFALLTAAWVSTQRDVGAGLYGGRPGPARGSARLGTPVGIAWRFTRAPFWGWLAGLVVWGIAIGSLSNEMTDLVAANPTITEALGIEQPEQLITVMAMLIAALGAASLAVQGIGRLSREEQAGRVGLALSTGASRVGLWTAWALVVAVQSTVVLLTSALSAGLTTALVTDDSGGVGSSLSAGLALVPAVLFILAVAAALQAVTPSATSLAWLLVGWAAVVGILAEALQLAGWARDLSPLHAVGNVPIDPASGPAIAVLSGISVALVALGAWRFGRRDLSAG